MLKVCKPFVRKGAWVRIPPSPFQEFRRCGTPFCITGDGKMTQKRGEEAEWRLYDREYGKLRFIPCTYLAQTAVRTLFKARLETGAGIHAPLIVEGKSGRLTPERYKKFVDKVLESGIPEYSKTSRTDLIRASFEGYCRNICGMDIGQVQKILGLQAQQT